MGGAKGIGGQLLGLPDDRDRVAEINERLHAVDINSHALAAQELGELRVAAAMLVAGNVEGHHTHLAEAFEGLVDGRAVLVEVKTAAWQR